MKKFIYISFATLCIVTTACTKDNEGVKTEIEKTLPAIELTSMGLMNQVGPFALADSLIQVSFNGAVTNQGVGTFDFAWYDVPPANSTTPANRIDSLHFNSWNVPISKTDSNSIAVTWAPSTYPNTWTFSGNLILKIKKLPAGKPYTLRLYARTDDNNMATISTVSFITKK